MAKHINFLPIRLDNDIITWFLTSISRGVSYFLANSVEDFIKKVAIITKVLNY